MGLKQSLWPKEGPNGGVTDGTQKGSKQDWVNQRRRHSSRRACSGFHPGELKCTAYYSAQNGNKQAPHVETAEVSDVRSLSLVCVEVGNDSNEGARSAVRGLVPPLRVPAAQTPTQRTQSCAVACVGGCDPPSLRLVRLASVPVLLHTAPTHHGNAHLLQRVRPLLELPELARRAPEFPDKISRVNSNAFSPMARFATASPSKLHCRAQLTAVLGLATPGVGG